MYRKPGQAEEEMMDRWMAMEEMARWLMVDGEEGGKGGVLGDEVKTQSDTR